MASSDEFDKSKICNSFKSRIFITGSSEFLRRELKLDVTYLDFKDLSEVKNEILKGNKPIIEITKIRRELEILPKKSLIAFLSSDETIDANLNKFIFESGLFSSVIRNYIAESKLSFPILRIFKANLIETKNLLSRLYNIIEIIKWGIIGIGMWRRKRRIMRYSKFFGVNSIDCPLGYTDVFAESFIKYYGEQFECSIGESQSLLELSNIKQFKDRTYQFVFIGQNGNTLRKYAIQEAKLFPNSLIIIREGYGGEFSKNDSEKNLGYEYVKSLFNSKIAVCPPGNISGNTFRLLESLLCGCFVAVMPHIPSDPTFTPLGIKGDELGVTTWKRKFKELGYWSDFVLESKARADLKSLCNEIADARKNIKRLNIE